MKDLNYIHGVKGICGVSLVIFHYLLSFGLFGYVGWSAPVTTAVDKWNYYFQYFPYSILTNFEFPLYIFFAIITFLPATIYFANHNADWVKRQAVVRYGRFFPYIALALLCSMVAYHTAPTRHLTYSALMNNPWIGSLYPHDMTLANAIKHAFTVTFVGSSDINTVLWCFDYIFLSSYLAYAFLLLFGTAKHRTYLYLPLACLCLYDTTYAAFLAGVMAADLLYRVPQRLQGHGGLLVGIGILLGVIPEVCYPSSQWKFAVYAVGIFLILIGINLSASIKHWLSHPRLTTLGSYSFALILVHMPVVTMVSIPQFLYTYPRFGYGWSVALVLLSGIVCNTIATICFDKIAAPLSQKLSRKLANTFLP